MFARRELRAGVAVEQHDQRVRAVRPAHRLGREGDADVDRDAVERLHGAAGGPTGVAGDGLVAEAHAAALHGTRDRCRSGGEHACDRCFGGWGEPHQRARRDGGDRPADEPARTAGGVSHAAPLPVSPKTRRRRRASGDRSTILDARSTLNSGERLVHRPARLQRRPEQRHTARAERLPKLRRQLRKRQAARQPARRASPAPASRGARTDVSRARTAPPPRGAATARPASRAAHRRRPRGRARTGADVWAAPARRRPARGRTGRPRSSNAISAILSISRSG